MATRNRALRGGDDLKEFKGKVRHWEKEWLIAGNGPVSRKLKLLQWRPKDSTANTAETKPKYTSIIPIKNPDANKIQKIGVPVKPQKLKVKLKVASSKPDLSTAPSIQATDVGQTAPAVDPQAVDQPTPPQIKQQPAEE